MSRPKKLEDKWWKAQKISTCHPILEKWNSFRSIQWREKYVEWQTYNNKARFLPETSNEEELERYVFQLANN